MHMKWNTNEMNNKSKVNYIYKYENEYEYEIHVHSHLVFNTALGKLSKMEK